MKGSKVEKRQEYSRGFFLDGQNISRFYSGRFDVSLLLEVLRYLKRKKANWKIEVIQVFLPQVYFSRSIMEYNMKQQRGRKEKKKKSFPENQKEIDRILKAIKDEPELFVKCPSGDIDDYYMIDSAHNWEERNQYR